MPRWLLVWPIFTTSRRQSVCTPRTNNYLEIRDHEHDMCGLFSKRTNSMFYTDGKLQYPVRGRKSQSGVRTHAAAGHRRGRRRDPGLPAVLLPGAGGREARRSTRDMLLHTATEEIGHIEMLSTAVALNLEGAACLQEEAAA